MRNARPFFGNFLVHGYAVAKVELVQLVILIAKRIGRERRAGFGKPAHEKLKLGKHGLAIYRAAEAFKEVVYKICALALIGGVVEQVFDQQHLVAGGGDFCHEYNIMRVAGRLMLYGMIGMQRVAHFVRNGEHAVQRVLLIEQNIWMRIAAGGIRAAALAFVFVNVYPAVAEAFLQYIKIILAERGKSLKYYLLGLFVRYLLGSVAHYGRVKVIHVQFVNAHKLFAQVDVFMQMLYVVMHGLYKVMVNLHGHFGFIKRSLQRGIIMPCLRIEYKRFHLRVKERGGCVLERCKRMIQRFKRGLAHVHVPVFHKGDEGTLRYLQRIAFGIVNIGEADVCIAEG